jgi:LPS O-antigen subunit length determinant protein (WzzB/FepE family)
MSQTNIENSSFDDIDLIELIKNIWAERTIILTAVLLFSLVGGLYAFTATPIYRVSAQLNLPKQEDITDYKTNISSNSLNPIYSTKNIDIETQELLALFNNISKGNGESKIIEKKSIEKIFTYFLTTLSSNQHISSVASNHKQLISDAFGITVDDNLLKRINSVRNIEYPNTAKKINTLSPDNYTISLTGINREKLSSILKYDLELAAISTTKIIKMEAISELQKTISRLNLERISMLELQDEKIEAHKTYLLSNRKNKIQNLEEAYRIAQSLGIEMPQQQQEIEQNSSLYLRGSLLLGMQIAHLKSLNKTTFNDEHLLKLEAHKTLLASNKSISQLNREKERLIAISSTLPLYSIDFDAPKNPIKPRKILIIIISILLGGFIGLFAVLGKILIRKINT